MAEKLAADGGDSQLRSAISRAYYSAFNTARQFLQRESISVPKDGQAHDFVWKQLKQPGRTRLLLGAGNNGERLKARRTKADYRDEFTGLESESKQAIDEARQILKALAPVDR
ncbi:MAG: HEPN domain-containing protein [Polyangiaceae bacterium]